MFCVIYMNIICPFLTWPYRAMVQTLHLFSFAFVYIFSFSSHSVMSSEERINLNFGVRLEKNSVTNS